MIDYTLTAKELEELYEAHRNAQNSRDAYRINAVILLGENWVAADVAAALLIDSDTVRNHFRRYRQGGLRHLLQVNYIGSEPYLSAEQLENLDDHLQQHIYLTAKAVADWVKEQWQVCYTPNGMGMVLKRLGYVYKRMSLIRDAVNPNLQKQFAEEKINKNEVVLSMDTVPSQRPLISAYGWVKCGQEMPVKTNRWRKQKLAV